MLYVGVRAGADGLAAYYSFFNWTGLGPLDDFVGLDNYRRAFSDPVFRGGVRHNAIIVVLSMLIQLPLAHRRWRCCSTARCAAGRCCGTVLFAPYVLSEVITAVIWLLHPAARPARSTS